MVMPAADLLAVVARMMAVPGAYADGQGLGGGGAQQGAGDGQGESGGNEFFHNRYPLERWGNNAAA
jgi:hypothetical protein